MDKLYLSKFSDKFDLHFYENLSLGYYMLYVVIVEINTVENINYF